jgi:tripartite-type tricarboxylate transporter receptor subunit TctC
MATFTTINRQASFKRWIGCFSISITCSISLLGFPASAQNDTTGNFPNRVIKIIVPFNAGGPADALARPLAEALSKRLGSAVIVENKPGANAAIASQFVAKSNADGYTLLFASDAGMSLAPATQKNLPYDPAKDFVGITMVAQLSQLLFVGSNFPAKSVQELQAIAGKAPNSVVYASIGMGSLTHVAFGILKSCAQYQNDACAIYWCTPSDYRFSRGQCASHDVNCGRAFIFYQIRKNPTLSNRWSRAE